MRRRKASQFGRAGGILAAISAFGFLLMGWVTPASAQISTAFDLTGLGTRNPVEIALSLINWMLTVLALVAVVFVLYGGFLWLTSRGEEEQIEKAKRVLINAGIGLLIILSAWGIVLYILTILLGATGGNAIDGSDCTDCYGSGFPAGASTFYVRSTDPGDTDADVTLCTDIYVLMSKDINTDSIGTTNFYLELLDATSLQPMAASGESCAINTDCASAACDETTLTCVGDTVAGTIELDQLDSGESTDHFSFLPEVNFESSALYQGTVVGSTSGVTSTDASGALVMDTDYTFAFTTGNTTDVTPPTVQEVTGESPYPADNETNVCLNTPVYYKFSEAIRTYTVEDSTSFLVSDDAGFGTDHIIPLRSFDFGGDRDYAGTRPSSALSENSAYYAELYGGDLTEDGTYANVITDACGNPLDGNYNGTSQGASDDTYYPPSYDADDDGVADDPINWETGTNAECIPLIQGIDPTNEYYGYGDDQSTVGDDSDSTSIAIKGEFLAPSPEIIFNDTIYSSTSDLTCFNQSLPPDEDTICLISAASGEADTKLPVGAEDGPVSVDVFGESSECQFDADSDGTANCDFTENSPHIDYMDPHDGAVGDYVTIGGEHFGESEGSVYFRADAATVAAGYPEYVLADLPDACGDTWSDTQIVVVVPNEYPVDTDLDIQVEAADGHWSNLTYFTISTASRPSLCSLSPECNDAGAQSGTLTGKKMGTSGIVYYGTGIGTGSSWTPNSVHVTSPSDITNGTYYVKISVDGELSNGVAYEIPCSSNSSSTSPTADSSFYVVSTDPDDDATDVTLCTDVYAQFSQEIDISSATADNFYLTVQGGASDEATCTTNNECASALCGGGGSCKGSVVDGTIELDASAASDGTDHISFLPHVDFESNTTYIGTLASGPGGVLADDGTMMTSDHTFSFTTGTSTDVIPPTVVVGAYSPYPADGATDICLNTAIAFGFSEAMRTYTFNDTHSFLVSSASDFATASLQSLHSFTFGANRNSATTRVLQQLTADSTYYTQLYGGDVATDGTITNAVTDACGNPLDGNSNGTAQGTSIDDYLSGTDVSQPINWDTGEDPECAPIIASISPKEGYYGQSSSTTDSLTITGSNLGPFPTVTFYHGIVSEEGALACFDNSTPQDIVADCFDSTSTITSLKTKIPVGASDGSVSITAAGLSSSCEYDADGDGSPSCVIAVDSPVITSVSPNSAAAGDYITIRGTNFGSATGTVYFKASNGTSVVAELPPATCGDTWSDTQIIVIVPSDWTVGTVLDIQVETSATLGSHYSDEEAFTVTDANRPSVCAVSPSCGDSAGEATVVIGKKFGLTQGTTGAVEYDATPGTITSWSDTSISDNSPSTIAQDDYSLTVVDSSGGISNSVDYSIPCNNAPQVVDVTSCDVATEIYPLPNPRPDETETCVNSQLEVMFDQPMDATTFTASTLNLVRCNTATDAVPSFLATSCTTSNLIHPSNMTTGLSVVYSPDTYYGFEVNPSAALLANTWYQVTVSADVESTTGVGLAEDYVYHFKVRDSSDVCELDSIAVQPSTKIVNAYCADANADGDTADAGECPRTDGVYAGNAYSSECMLLDPGSYSWLWSLANPTGANCTDTDADGLSTSQETSAGTDAAINDTDSDGYEDGWEVRQGTNPLVADPYVAADDGDLTPSDICEDTEYCAVSGGVGTCTSLVGDFSSSGANVSVAAGTPQTVYPAGDDNYNEGEATINATASSLSDDSGYTVDFGYCASDRDCELSCSGSVCDESINRCTPVITNFTPTDGALGTWVTINGCMFGSSKGNVQFESGSIVADTEWPDDAMCGDTWSNTQIISQFPATYAVSDVDTALPTSAYAVNVITKYDLEDTTTSPFQVDSTVQVGLCRVYPDTALEGDATSLYGQNFGETEGTVTFNPASGTTRIAASADDTTWTDTRIDTVVPDGTATGVSASGKEGVKVVLSDTVTQSSALDFTVTYVNPSITSSDPANEDTNVCPNAVLNVTFSEDMSRVILGADGTVRLYEVQTAADGSTSLYRLRIASLTWDGRTLSVTPNAILNPLSDYVLSLISADTTTGMFGSTSGLTLDGGTYNIQFMTGATLCLPDHVGLDTSANELTENLDLDGNGAIEDIDVTLEAWTYTAARESREWTARMYDSNDNEISSVGNLTWDWTWKPLYSETACVNDVYISSTANDADFDLLTTEEETALGTNPDEYDTDGDHFGDGWEVQLDTDPLDAGSYPGATDIDGDGLLDSEETQYSTDYTTFDTDEDGFGDGWEVLNGSDPLDATVFPTVADIGSDADNDGLLEDASASTGSPTQEESLAGTSSTIADSDSDGYLDGWEVLFGSNPADSTSIPVGLDDPGADTDGDGLGAVEEVANGTSDSSYDSDSDGFGDGWEVDNATDPTSDTSYPTETETLTGTDASQTVIAGDTDGSTSSVAVTANALTGWSGILSASDAVDVAFCSGDSWQYNDPRQRMSLWYCDTNRNLPSLSGPATVVSAGADYLAQYLFPSDQDANDTIGIRVYANSTDFLTPAEWVDANVPNAGDLSLSSTTIDGYPAVTGSNAAYVDVSYVASSSANYRLYNNIYLMTWTEGGDAQTIASQLLDHWKFNTNVDDSATTDAISGPEQGCVYSDKEKLQRDTERVIELHSLANLLEGYYPAHSAYPLPKSDSVDSYIINITNSVWPSWQGALGNVLGEALDEDPINAFIDGVDENGDPVTDYFTADSTNECPYSPDTNEFYDTSGTCWDNINLHFNAPSNSFVYLYKVDKADQVNAWLYGQMEFVNRNVTATTYYPAARHNTWKSTSTTYDPCSPDNECPVFNFAVHSTAGAAFVGGE